MANILIYKSSKTGPVAETVVSDIKKIFKEYPVGIITVMENSYDESYSNDITSISADAIFLILTEASLSIYNFHATVLSVIHYATAVKKTVIPVIIGEGNIYETVIDSFPRIENYKFFLRIEDYRPADIHRKLIQALSYIDKQLQIRTGQEQLNIELNKRTESLSKQLLKLHKKRSSLLETVMYLTAGVVTIVVLAYIVRKEKLVNFLGDSDMSDTVFTVLSSIGFIITLFITFFQDKLTKEISVKSELNEIGVQALQNQIEEDFFTNLVKINFKYIDRYYDQTQLQANKSFTTSLGAAILSFVIIIFGIILMLYKQTSSAYIATASGVLSEFIAAVFFYLYNKTILKMGEYHHKLVLTQNMSLALKITEQMEGEVKTKAQLSLIEQLTKDINQHIASKPQ